MELLADVSPTASVVFLMYLCLVIYVIMMVLTGVCVHQATRVADEDLEYVIQTEMARQNSTINTLRRFLQQGCGDGVNVITLQQLKQHMEDPKVKCFFHAFDLSPWDIQTYFEHTSGDVTIDEFIKDCLRLKGHAKNVDIMAIRKDLAIIRTHLRTYAASPVGD